MIIAEVAVLREQTGQGYGLAVASAPLLAAAAEVIERHSDRNIDVTDASIVVWPVDQGAEQTERSRDPYEGVAAYAQPNVNGSRVPPVSSTQTDLSSR